MDCIQVKTYNHTEIHARLHPSKHQNDHACDVFEDESKYLVRQDFQQSTLFSQCILGRRNPFYGSSIHREDSNNVI